MENNLNRLSKNLKNYVKRYCRTYCKTLVEEYRDIMAERMDFAIAKYYASYDPVYYNNRSGKMLRNAYKKYTKTAGNPNVYAAGIILDSRYYGSQYPIHGPMATRDNIYKWSVIQGNHGREIVGDFRYDNPHVLYMAKDTRQLKTRWNSGFGTGYRKTWTDKQSKYIYANHSVGSDPNGNPFSPYKDAIKYNPTAIDKAGDKALKAAKSIIAPGYFW